MRFVSLSIRNFRNISSISVPTDSEDIVLIGTNGQGKTSFLESIYMLCYGSSFRTQHLREAVMHGKDGFRISATDSDPAAIKEAIRRTGYGIYSLLDASSPLPHADTILMIFFGHLSDDGNLRRYLSSAGKLIYIISEHRGQSGSLRHRPGEPDATMSFLSSQKGIRWRRIPFEADFSQPLSSIEDAWEYTSRMYGNEKAGKYMEFIRRTDGGYLLPNHKHSSIFIITKEEECEEDTHALDDHGSAAPSRS